MTYRQLLTWICLNDLNCLRTNISLENKSDVKHRNTLDCLNQYRAQIVNTLEVSTPSTANVDECPLKCRWVPLPLKMCYRELMNKTNSPVKELERVTPFHVSDHPHPQHPTSNLSPTTPPTKIPFMLVMSLLSFKRQMHVTAKLIA